MPSAQPSKTLPCEALFGRDRGRQMLENVERLTGKPCPCKTGQTCPLLGPLTADLREAV